MAAERPAQVSCPSVPDRLAQGVSEAGRPAQPVQPGGQSQEERCNLIQPARF